MDITKLEKALQTAQAGLSLADRVAGFIGGLRSVERRARYAHWRSLQLELRSARLLARGKDGKSEELLGKSKIWSAEAARLEAVLVRSSNSCGHQ